MFWSQTTIAGKPRLLVVDASGNAEGWEADFCDRVFHVLQRKEVGLVGDTPLRVGSPDDLGAVIQEHDFFNCLFLLCHGSGPDIPTESRLEGFWRWLSKCQVLQPKLLAICTWDDFDPEASRAVLLAKDSFARLVVVPQSPLGPRAAGLFFMKFFTELDLHAEDSITGKMVWFSHSKAKEILKRRHLPGQVGVRC